MNKLILTAVLAFLVGVLFTNFFSIPYLSPRASIDLSDTSAKIIYPDKVIQYNRCVRDSVAAGANERDARAYCTKQYFRE